MIIRYKKQIGNTIDYGYIDVSGEDKLIIIYRLAEMVKAKLITEEEYKQYLIELKLEEIKKDF